MAFDLQVPPACKGIHTIKITDDSNWTSSTASATFTVLPGITIFPRIGWPYTSITVTGNGFACFEKDIKVTWDKTVLPISAAANHLGIWSVNFDAPDPVKGEYYIGAFSSSTNVSEIGEHKFIVGPFAKMQPSSGPVGTEITVEGFGFRTSEDGITFTWDNQIILCNLIAGTDGVLNATLNIPPTTQGHHLLGLFGSDFTPKGIIPDMDFNVVPNIQLQPPSGNKGTRVTVNGTGFNQDEAITLSFEGTSLNANIVADDKGSFSINFEAPQSAVKENKVKATGTASNSAETLFIIDKVTPPAPSLVSPTQGAELEVFDSVGDVFLGTTKQLIRIISFRNSEQRKLGPSDIKFDWSDIKVQGKTTYTLEIANGNDFLSPAVLKKELVDSEYTLSRDDILTIGSYTWRVMAVDDIGNEGLWSDADEFEVIPMSNQVLIMSLVIPLVFIGAMVGLATITWRRYKARS
ncbi:MAG: IPT/TIG domain-containing protein [Dehalococcoidia bacterium]